MPPGPGSDSKENALRRFAARAHPPADPAQPGPPEILRRDAGPHELSAMYDRLMAVIASRPGARIVTTREGRADQAYRDLLASLDG